MTTERKPLPRARARRAWKVALMDLCCLGLLAAWLLFALGTLYPRYLARTAPEEALPYLATAGEQSAAALTPEMTPEARIRAYDLRDNLWRRGLLALQGGGVVLMYLMLGGNNGQTLSGLDPSYTDFVRGTLFTVGGDAVPKYVLYAVILTAIMWVIWNKTKFGKNMFAVGSNEEAANVSGVNVFWTIVLVFVLAGAMYGITGFIEGARIASCSANTGLNYESDAIAACVIGGVSFVGGTGKISGIVVGVFLLQIIFVGLNFRRCKYALCHKGSYNTRCVRD